MRGDIPVSFFFPSPFPEGTRTRPSERQPIASEGNVSDVPSLGSERGGRRGAIAEGGGLGAREVPLCSPTGQALLAEMVQLRFAFARAVLHHAAIINDLLLIMHLLSDYSILLLLLCASSSVKKAG